MNAVFFDLKLISVEERGEFLFNSFLSRIDDVNWLGNIFVGHCWWNDVMFWFGFHGYGSWGFFGKSFGNHFWAGEMKSFLNEASIIQKSKLKFILNQCAKVCRRDLGLHPGYYRLISTTQMPF